MLHLTTDDGAATFFGDNTMASVRGPSSPRSLSASIATCFSALSLWAAMASSMAQAKHPVIPREAFAAWQRIDRRPLPKRWHMHYRSVIWNDGDKQEDASSEQIVIVDGTGPLRQVVVMRTHAPGGEVPTATTISDVRARATGVWAINSTYTFSIRRPAPSLAWGVSTMTPERQSPMAMAVRSTLEQPRTRLYSIWKRTPMRIAVTLPYCKVVSSGKVTRNGKEFFQVEIVAEDSKPARYEDFVAGGKHTILLDPENDWMVAREEYISGDLHYVTEREIDPESGLILRQVDISFDPTSGKRDGIQTRSFAYFFADEEPVPRDLFYLTGYGIPEPAEFRRSTGWIWGLVAAGVLLVLCGVWLVRRASRTPSTG